MKYRSYCVKCWVSILLQTYHPLVKNTEFQTYHSIENNGIPNPCIQCNIECTLMYYVHILCTQCIIYIHSTLFRINSCLSYIIYLLHYTMYTVYTM